MAKITRMIKDIYVYDHVRNFESQHDLHTFRPEKSSLLTVRALKSEMVFNDMTFSDLHRGHRYFVQPLLTDQWLISPVLSTENEAKIKQLQEEISDFKDRLDDVGYATRAKIIEEINHLIEEILSLKIGK